jgi:uncharacterized protein
MSITGRLLEWMFKLPPARTRNIAVEQNVPAPMPDGVVLLADRYYPRDGEKPPTILIRTPYGRTAGKLMGPIFAERGFQVVVQSCRGTFGSGGEFDPFRNERSDGLATFEWLKQQPWFSGEVATVGQSYLGFVQWAIATEAGPELKAMATQITTSQFRTAFYTGESFSLDTILTWIYLVSHQEGSLPAVIWAQMRRAARLQPLINHLPIRDLDRLATGKRVPFYQDWLAHNEAGDEWWAPVDFSESVADVSVPVLMLGGWYDIFVMETLADYNRLRQAGRQPYLTLGPWTHTDMKMISLLLNESLVWFQAHLLGEREKLRQAPVRIFVMGANEWREYPEWPPAGYEVQRWHLQTGAGLAQAAPAESTPDHYRYDPADPTPAVGGSSLSQNSGPRDNRALEARSDVLLYTSEPLEHDVEVIGQVQAELYVGSTLEHTDFFARLCDVDPSGKSINICDGLLRLVPGRPPADPEGVRRICIELWPTAHRFRRGHRIRVQISSGSHPRFIRNPGSGEPLSTATTLKVADQRVYHDPAHPSAILLPAALLPT